MWTDADRSRYRQAGDYLPSDWSDAEWDRFGTSDSAGEARRTAAPDRHALGDERDLRSSANRLPVALFAARSSRRCVWRSSNVPTTVQNFSSCRVARLSNRPAWFGRNRRLAKDYENLADTLAALITLACIQLSVRHLARPYTFQSGSERMGHYKMPHLSSARSPRSTRQGRSVPARS